MSGQIEIGRLSGIDVGKRVVFRDEFDNHIEGELEMVSHIDAGSTGLLIATRSSRYTTAFLPSTTLIEIAGTTPTNPSEEIR